MAPEDQRAGRLLLSYLTPEQAHTFQGGYGILVVGSRGGRYIIGYPGPVVVYSLQGNYCIHLPMIEDYGAYYFPWADQVLAQKCLIEADENALFRIGHFSGVPTPAEVYRFLKISTAMA